MHKEMAITGKQKTQMYHIGAAVILVLMLILIVYLWRVSGNKNAKHAGAQTFDNPGNPQHYGHGEYLLARAAQGLGDHGNRSYDFSRGHSHHPVMSNDFHGYHMLADKDNMSVGAQWDHSGSYGNTADTWGLPPQGGDNPDYSGFSKDTMSVGAQWGQSGVYGRAAGTNPIYDYSGYHYEVPTPADV